MLKTNQRTRFVLSAGHRPNIKKTFLVSALLIALISIAALLTTTDSIAGPADVAVLTVMKTGLGDGTVTSTTPGINCGTDCDESYINSVTVTLNATPAAGSTFTGWSGGCSGTGACTAPVTVIGDLAVRAEFTLTAAIPPLLPPGGDRATLFAAEAISTYLAITGTMVDSPARFVASLPGDFKQNWILMSRSESLQTGTAGSPRILLPSDDAKYVFTVGMTEHSSYPGAHPNAVEYMQWDAAQKNFRFHEIILAPIPAMGTEINILLPDGTFTTTLSIPPRSRGVAIDDPKCFKCHSTRNVINRGSTPGTTGITPGAIPFKSKPNWDAYDSWGGMLPFNRDRIYQDSVEAAAFRHILNLWNWRNSPENDAARQVIEQLVLQPSYVASSSPHSITRDPNSVTDDLHIRFGFDPLPAIATTTAPIGYSFDRPASAPSTVTQGGRYVTLRTSAPNPVPGSANDNYGSPGSDEGRGVQLFDLLGGLDGTLNAQRIADELINHQFATGSVPIDVRPIVLAIFAGCATSPDTLAAPMTPARAFFDARNGMDYATLELDTRQRRQNLPLRKVDIQKIDLDRSVDPYLMNIVTRTGGLIQAYGAATPLGVVTTTERLRQEIFRRPVPDLGPGDSTIMGGIFVDREDYNGLNANTKLALSRYFLEPLGVSVDKWSMNVRGRSRDYNFADVFGNTQSTLTTVVGNNYLGHPAGGADCTQLIADSMAQWSRLPAPDVVPTYTDIQRILNKSCVECHGGLGYPPYANFGNYLDFSEDESPPAGSRRLSRSYALASALAGTTLASSTLYGRITSPNGVCAATPAGLSATPQLMPCGGPKLSQTDIETIERWILGGRPYTEGDPHLRTIDGVSYDFQSWGEFVLLRGEDLEIQTRQTGVGTEGPLGPDAHTGLTSCVSVNTAVALRIGNHRITYQPNLSGEPDPSGLQLRIDGKLTVLPDQPLLLRSGERIRRTLVPGGVQIEYPGGTVVVLTPNFWDYYQVWYMNVDVTFARATEGVIGAIAPGNWLPALPDGTLMGPRPKDLHERYLALYETFADAWRVSDGTSLFDYAPGASTKTFTFDSYPGEASESCILPQAPIPPQKPLSLEQADQLCKDVVDANRKANCVQDVMVTGEAGFAEAYLRTEQVVNNALPTPPLVAAPENNATLPAGAVTFTSGKATDADGDPLTYRLCLWSVDERFTFDKCDAVPTQTPSWDVELEPGRSYFWKVITEDGKGGTTESQTRRVMTPPVAVDRLDLFVPFLIR